MTSETGLTAALGELAADPGVIDAEAIDAARVGFADAVGMMVLGASEAAVGALIDWIGPDDLAGYPSASLNTPARDLSSTRPGFDAALTRRHSVSSASVLLTAGLARADEAALINATAAHAWALDDVGWGCHPSALLMPALLAQGELQGASGINVLRAGVVGCEVLAELAAREPDPLHRTGWQPASMLGPIAVAAAVASLMRLDSRRSAHAIGIAASAGGGLVANFGTPTKALHVGRASAAGLLAAQLAARGVTASIDALERETGLLRTLSPAGRVDTGPGLRRTAGRWRIVDEGLCLKRHPVCYALHRVVDAAIDVGGLPQFDARSVLGIEITLGATQSWMAPHQQPTSTLQARYSAEFAAVSGLLARAAGFEQLRDSFIESEAVTTLISRCRRVTRDERSSEDPVFSPADRVRVELANGVVLDSGEVAYAKGHARRPLSGAEREAKFRECVSSRVADPAPLLEVLDGLAGLPDVRRLGDAAVRAGLAGRAR